ncbi:hypothetical protein [Humibacter sp. RRB41]|uniref:hypothetical protein n=1 Tax=Humibacter sp. RRB41 TaxID=2919946 RepID=UPI001FA9BD06|nr:hypothetical protein [Humibacter sp. RRB41]
MSTAARKARKRGGVKFEHKPKVGTPITERAWFQANVPGAFGTRHSSEFRSRSNKKRAAALEARGLSTEGYER